MGQSGVGVGRNPWTVDGRPSLGHSVTLDLSGPVSLLEKLKL